MSVHDTRKAAEELQVPFKAAAWCRVRYLRNRLRQNAADQEFFDVFTASGRPWDSDSVTVSSRLMTIDELVAAARELHTLARLVNGAERQKERISDEQIEIARSVPVNTLVEFVRGKARAWCHEDRNPSMFFGTRANVAVCPVCDKKFGPIDVLMSRDGLTFIDAVKQLAA